MCINAFCIYRDNLEYQERFNQKLVSDYNVLCCGDDSFGYLTFDSSHTHAPSAIRWAKQRIASVFQDTTGCLGITSTFNCNDKPKGYLELDYCSSFFAQTSEGFVLHPEVGRLLSKNPLTTENYTNPQCYLALAVEKLVGLCSELRYVPELFEAYSVLKIGLTLSPGRWRKILKKLEYMHMRRANRFVWSTSYRIAPYTADDILERYKVTTEDLKCLAKDIIQTAGEIVQIRNDIADRIITRSTERYTSCINLENTVLQNDIGSDNVVTTQELDCLL
jgi:hypothetical protein